MQFCALFQVPVWLYGYRRELNQVSLQTNIKHSATPLIASVHHGIRQPFFRNDFGKL
jgi:hypothetical protein